MELRECKEKGENNGSKERKKDERKGSKERKRKKAIKWYLYFKHLGLVTFRDGIYSHY